MTNNNSTISSGNLTNVSGWIQLTFPWHNSNTTNESVKLITRDRDGLDCKGPCKEFYEFVEPNQEDGTFMCFKCRNGY